MTSLLILTGASGSGKTALAEAIERARPGLADVFFFDSVGVPSPEQMTADWGSGEAWQRAATIQWLARIAARVGARPALFEGQMRFAFLTEGLHAAGLTNARILLVDCNDDVRLRRLATHRRQPELANPQTLSWAAYLRREARESGYETLDTSNTSLDDGVERLFRLLNED